MFRILRPTTLQWYIFKEFLVSLVLALTACTMLILLYLMYQMRSDYADFGVSLTQIALLTPYLLHYPLIIALPLASMIAAVTVFGRLTAESEILAAQAGGASIRALALPILLSGLLISGASLWCNGPGQQGWKTIREEILKVDKPEFINTLDRPGGTFQRRLDDGSVMRVNFLFDPDGGDKRPVHIAYFFKEKVGYTFVADHHVVIPPKSETDRTITLKLYNMQVLGQNTFFGEVEYVIQLPSGDSFINIGKTRGHRGWAENYADAEKIRASFHDRTQFLLQRASDFGAQAVAGSTLDPASPALATTAWNDASVHIEAAYGNKGAIERQRAEEVEFQRKMSMSFLPFSMVVLGIGLGLLVRKSQRLIGFLLGILVFALLYYPLSILTKEAALAGNLPLWGIWIPNVILLVLGWMLTNYYERNRLSWPLALLFLAGVVALVIYAPSRNGEDVSNRDKAIRGVIAFFVILFTRFVVKDHARTAAAGAAQLAWSGGATIFTGIAAVLRLPMTVIRACFFIGKKTDAYIGASFLNVLIAVVVCASVIVTALDLVEHGAEVVDSVRKADEPQVKELEPRTRHQALLDVFSYYGILSLERACDLLPLLILIAGLFCVSVIVNNQEHLLLKSAGMPLQRALRPIILTTLLFSSGVIAVREFWMPQLIMQREYLKPLVYRRNPAPTALALYTTDEKGKPVLFQMSSYSPYEQSGNDIRIYLLGEAVGTGGEKRIPTIEADRATWNGTSWTLQSFQRTRTGKARAVTTEPMLNEGNMTVARPVSAPAGTPALTPDGFAKMSREKTILTEWSGGISPAFIESERLGSGVMRLSELKAASVNRPELQVEWWRRVSEGGMGLILLWIALPLLVVGETGVPLLGIGISMLVAGVYWAANMAMIGAANSGLLPPWSPAAPHGIFCFFGLIQYYLRMKT